MNPVLARLCAFSSRTLHRLHGGRLIAAAETACAFLLGKGSGSGWDATGETRSVARFVTNPDPVVFDVGANNGEWSAKLAAHMQRPDARFHLFECSPQVLPYLPKRLPRIPNPTVVEAAVSEQEGEIVLHTPIRGSGLASVHARRDVSVSRETYESVTVPAITLDGYVHRNGIDRIDLLKMDIEGHELAALRGAVQTFEAGIIRTVSFEFGSANVNSRTFFRDFWDFFDERGFKLHRIIAGGGVVAVPRYGEDLEYFRGATNYIAHRPG